MFCCLFVISFFCLFAWRLFVFSRGVISSFRLFAWRFFRLFVLSHGVFSPRKDEKTPCEKTTRRITPREKSKRRHAKREKTPCEKTTKLKSFRVAFIRLFAQKFRLFSWRVSSFRMALFRLFIFSHGVLSSFPMASFRLFVFARGVFSPRKEEKTKWHKPATINTE